MRKMLIMLACGVLVLSGILALMTPADARKGGGYRGGGHGMGHARAYRGSVHRNTAVRRNFNGNINRNVARSVNRNVNRNINRRYVYRNGRWGYWRNGVWVVAPLVAGATYVASCAYEYNRWQATGSAYWRDRYYACAN